MLSFKNSNRDVVKWEQLGLPYSPRPAEGTESPCCHNHHHHHRPRPFHQTACSRIHPHSCHHNCCMLPHNRQNLQGRGVIPLVCQIQFAYQKKRKKKRAHCSSEARYRAAASDVTSACQAHTLLYSGVGVLICGSRPEAATCL